MVYVRHTFFGHANIIKYCNRPFDNVQEMDDCIIQELNSRVKPRDILYHLGDFCFGRRSQNVSYYLNQIACNNIVLILGNHDKIKYLKNERFQLVLPIFHGKINGQSMTLCHYAMRIWNKSHYGAWHLYGHSHGSLADDPNALSMDVGVDTNHYIPYHFDEIKERLSQKEFKPIDHHG